MGTTCSQTCCSSENSKHEINQIDNKFMSSQSRIDMLSIIVPDESELDTFEKNEHQPIFKRASESQIYCLLKKNDKDQSDYETLAIRDAHLAFQSVQLGYFTYIGQTKQLAPNLTSLDENSMSVEVIKCGYGKLRWPDGSVFEGYWINDHAVSIGVFKTAQQETYEGVWQQDNVTGLSVFRKCLSDQKFTGKSVEVWSDGSYYFGDFLVGAKNGQGVYYWADGSKYQGQWTGDEMSGKGIFKWADGRLFTGEFKNGVMHGHGIYTWQDGRRYEGQYIQNKKQGFGIYTYSDGSKYKGEWVDGLQQGIGSLIDADSNYERKGIWNAGKLKQWLGTHHI